MNRPPVVPLVGAGLVVAVVIEAWAGSMIYSAQGGEHGDVVTW